ncbi:MAG TPA: DNA recombination protein RmuC [Candidatus Polarisedimenticolia bacterium]
MGIDTAATLLVLVLLALGMAVLGTALLRRRTPPAAPDPSIAMTQQQLTRLTEQVALLAAQVPKEVGQALGQVMGQVTARLSENAQTLQNATNETGKLIADVSHRLGELGRSSSQILDLGQEIRRLQQIFQAPKVRGGLGELTLASLLQQIFPADHFMLQHAFRDGETVDAALKLPGGLVPIDSKFPLSGFRALLDATNDEQRLKGRKAFARDVRKHVDDIAAKYIRPGEGTLDFALMYIPAENVFYEMIIRDEQDGSEDAISAYALRNKIIPVSPNSLYAYLQAIAFGLVGLRIEDRAREILRSLQQMHGDFGQFAESFDRGQKHLRNAQTAFNDAGERAGKIGERVEQFVRVADAARLDPGDGVESAGPLQAQEEGPRLPRIVPR